VCSSDLGKGTTASLIYNILKQGGVKAHLIGNIEKPALSLLAKVKRDNVYVYELSSHQLYGLKKSPNIAVFLNIYPDHLDYYKNFNEYLRAKQNIARYQKKENYFIFNPRDKNVRKTAKLSKAQKIPCFISRIKEVVAIGDIKLKGEFNLLNVAAAIETAKIFEIPKEKIKKAIKNFKSLPNRLEYVGTFKDITFYNDSSATIPEATMEAINALGDKVETIILGGSEKNVSFKNLAARIFKSKIKNLILFPTTGEKIWREIQKHQSGISSLKHFSAGNMAEAVKLSFEYTGKGKICLLSCASPSFSLFDSYKDRGKQFKKYIKKFGSFKK
jgi:UDP-N-acetylmuramoylalanine--D-glutamate ligase